MILKRHKLRLFNIMLFLGAVLSLASFTIPSFAAAKKNMLAIGNGIPAALMVELMRKPKRVDPKRVCWGSSTGMVLEYTCGDGFYDGRFRVLRYINGIKTEKWITIRFRMQGASEFSKVGQPGNRFLFGIHRYMENGQIRYTGQWQEEDHNGEFCQMVGDKYLVYKALYSRNVTRRVAKKNDPDWLVGTELECVSAE